MSKTSLKTSGKVSTALTHTSTKVKNLNEFDFNIFMLSHNTAT